MEQNIKTKTDNIYFLQHSLIEWESEEIEENIRKFNELRELLKSEHRLLNKD